MLTLLEQWRKHYDNLDRDFWDVYLKDEKRCLQILVQIETTPIQATLKQFSEFFSLDPVTFVGFLDGINDSLLFPHNMEKLTLDTIVTLDYDADLLYKNMSEANVDLSIWENSAYKKKYGRVPNGKTASNTKPILEQMNVPRCPTCGSTSVKKISGTKRWFTTGIFGIASGDFGKTMICKNCGYKW